MADVTLTIDGTPVTVPEGTLLVEAAKAIETDIPVYCYHPKLGPAGLCRICLVDVEKTPKLQIACNTTVAEGMVVHTRGPKVEEGRRAVMEFLLLNHPLDCPICDKGGECDLQDFSMAYGQSASRLADPKAKKGKAIDLGPTIVLDDERCIVCQRCTRFDEIITGERSLVVKDRGQRDVIATANGEPYVSDFSGNVTELCPVGALTSKTYRFRSRPWDLHRTVTTCTQCSVGCALHVDERFGAIARTMSVPEDPRSDGWLCDRGRYNVGFYGDARRLTSPLLRRGDEFDQISWDDAIALWASHVREATAQSGAGSIAALGGGRLTNEEIVLLARTLRGAGVENLDWRAGRQVQASPGAAGGTLSELDAAQLIVAIGRPPDQTAPVLDLRIRKAVRNGARYATVGLHAANPATRALAFEHVSDLAASLEGVERAAFVWDGIDVARGADAAALMEALGAKGVAVSGFVCGEFGNARGAEALGMLPGTDGMTAAGVLAGAVAGTVHVLSLHGVNPVLHHPAGAQAVRDALERVRFVVATDLFLTESAALAHLVLPACGPFEKSGHAYSFTGELTRLERAHDAPPGTLSDGEIAIALAAELSVALPAPAEVARLATASLPIRGERFADPELVGQSPSEPGVAPGGMRLAIAAAAFTGGGTSYFDERAGALRPVPFARLSPGGAAAAGVRAGERVRLVAGERVLRDLLVTIDPGARDDVVTICDGLPEAPANAFVEGERVMLDALVGGAR